MQQRTAEPSEQELGGRLGGGIEAAERRLGVPCNATPAERRVWRSRAPPAGELRRVASVAAHAGTPRGGAPPTRLDPVARAPVQVLLRVVHRESTGMPTVSADSACTPTATRPPTSPGRSGLTGEVYIDAGGAGEFYSRLASLAGVRPAAVRCLDKRPGDLPSVQRS